MTIAASGVATSSSAPAGARQIFIDAAKGFRIILVVLGHTLDGTISAGLFKPDGMAQAAFYLIYLFHMPLFFLLSALYVRTRVVSEPERFLRSLWQRVVWPFFLWTILQMVIVRAAGNLVNTPATISASALWSILWAPPGQYWFLHCLFLFHVLAFLVVRLRCEMALLLGAAALILSLLFVSDVWPLIGKYAPFLPFYAFGLILTAKRAIQWSQAFIQRTDRRFIAGSLVILFLASTIALRREDNSYYSPAAIGAQIFGIIVSLTLVSSCSQSMLRTLSWLGRRSMSIFLLHVIVAAGSRVILQKGLEISNGPLILVIATIAGLIGPCLILYISQRAKVSSWLGLT